MHVSFRNRLTFFFILLVVLPVLAVGIVGILIVRNAEEGVNDSGSARRTRRPGAAGELAGKRHGGRRRRSRRTIRSPPPSATATERGSRTA